MLKQPESWNRTVRKPTKIVYFENKTQGGRALFSHASLNWEEVQ